MSYCARVAMPSVIIAASLWFCATASAAVAHLTLQSQPGDFIGQGGTFDVTYGAPGQTLSAQNRQLTNGLPSELLFVVDQNGAGNTFGTLFFGTDQLGIPMQPGTYLNAQRADFASPGHPGLDVSWQNRGSNTLTGNFTVTQAVFNAANVLQSFAVSFEQHSEGATPALFGTFTYQIPEPATCMLFTTALLVPARRRRTVR